MVDIGLSFNQNLFQLYGCLAETLMNEYPQFIINNNRFLSFTLQRELSLRTILK